MVELSSIDQFLAQTLRQLRAGKAAPWSLNVEGDTEVIWARIDYHGIALLLYQSAERLTDWPEALTDRIAEEARLIALWEATHQETLSPLLKTLDEMKIEAVLMKGTALAYALHQDPATRRRGDTDLLVQTKDQACTREVFAQLGWYRKDDPHGLYYQEGWLHDAAGYFVHSVDLHWQPTDRPILHNVLPIEGFFARKQPIKTLGTGAYRPDYSLMIVHAVINQKWHAQHGYGTEEGNIASPRRLIWSVDFDLLVKALDDGAWERLLAHCRDTGVGPLVAEALRGMRSDLETEFPEARLDQLDAMQLAPAMKSYFINPDGLHQFRLDLNHTTGLRQKFRLLLMRAFPPRDHLIEKYPKSHGWPTPLLQGRMLFETAGRILRRASSR